MARCGCGNSCGCTIVQGTNILITGAGSPDNPYRVDNLLDIDSLLKVDPATGLIPINLIPDLPYEALLPKTGSYTIDTNGRVTGDPEGRTYTYNSDGTVHTVQLGSITRTYAYTSTGITVT